jgi:hypothetical protein
MGKKTPPRSTQGLAKPCQDELIGENLALNYFEGRKKANATNATNLAELDLFSDQSGLFPKEGLS